MKCTTCRAKDIELLTRYERFKNWLFYKLFPEDIIDLSQNKYTQGMGDGIKFGRMIERESLKKILKELYNIDI